MSNPPTQGAGGQGPAGPSYGGQPQSAGGAGGGGGTPQTSGPGQPQQGTSNTANAPPSAQNLNQIVTDYLKKKGFTKTEAVFRQETAHLGPDGKPTNRNDENGPKKYLKAFVLLKNWIDGGLDIYKFELSKLLWPVFVYSYLELVSTGYNDEAKNLLHTLRSHFEAVHREALQELSTVTLPQHVKENNMTRLYRESKYRIPLNQSLAGNMFQFLERESDAGGATVIFLLQTYCHVETSARGPIEPYSFEAIYRRNQNRELDEIDVREGIPGVFTGVTNRDLLDMKAKLKLGPLPMEPELRDDVRAELEEEDQLHPPTDGRPSLVDEFDKRIKREESADAPDRNELPLPPSRARDVVMEIQKVKENRDRFTIEGRSGSGSLAVSACMFTFHNTLGSVTCMDFSNDHQLVAVGTMDSYIRVWSLDGKPLKTGVDTEKGLEVNNRKLIGHSQPVYGLSFSDSIQNLARNIYDGGEDKKPDTSAKLLLSCSSDGQVRLWSLEFWTCLCVYKGHDGPVFRVLWNPQGHYFATAGWDKTVRVYAQDHASAQRIMVGHDSSVCAIAWHPNGTYVFSASDETDKSIRMWAITTGSCVRIFTGHTENISSLQCSPNGKILASADVGGNIFLWDIEQGKRIKRCRGHGKGGIPALSFSVESNVLVSGGLDGSVRIWDVALPADPSKTNSLAASATQAGPQPDGGAAAGQSAQGSTASASGASVGAGGSGSGKKKSKEVQVTADQISAFLTKKTPVLKVQFTRMNLIDPWADSAGASQGDDNSTTTPAGSSNPTASTTTASNTKSSSARPSRITPRRLVAQPTKLQAVEDDPLGPLGAAAATPPAASSSNNNDAGGGPLSSPLGGGTPPVPPSKELPIRTTMPQPQNKRTGGPPDPHRIDDDDDDDEHLFRGTGLASGRQPPPVQGALPSPVRTTAQPSMSIEQAAKPTFQITVGDPHKVGDLTSSHIVYSVRTRTTSKAYKQPEFEVKRRYRDFLWLYTTLHANNPGVVVPPPPEKQAVGRFESNFVEARRAALEKMLNKIAAHTTLQLDGDLKLFLESDAFNVDVKHKERKEPNLGESKSVLGSLGFSVGTTNKFVEQDDWFHDRRVYLDALENQLKALLKAMDGMVAQRKAMAEASGDFSASLHALSTVELSPTLSGPLDALSELQLTIRDVYDRQAQQDVLTFGIIIEEYIRLIGSVKQSFVQRQKAFHSWHSAESELQKRKTAQDKLLRQGKSQQDRLNQVSAEVADAERKVHQARLLFDDMGRLMRSELDRFEREKVEDFKSAVETFLESAVEAQKELIEKWETFLMQLDAEDDETVFYRPPVVQANKPAGNTAVDRARARIDEDSD
ncbi:Vps5 C terminal like-domain-containing protein [Podospora australis]|uniref:Vps5 C terminal like-domain-containing protein n=1 Tax=Podospora australis TaxID=1536484 RepID=A0AAN6WVF1_9PEZI|nr:Vps5 C terminal like-domain-containing protein [Podospora australis]